MDLAISTIEGYAIRDTINSPYDDLDRTAGKSIHGVLMMLLTSMELVNFHTFCS